MSNRYEYRVCQTQNGRVTFVNGAWQGRLPLDASPEAFDSCPLVWEYLDAAGWDGWEMVAAAEQTIIDEGAHSLVTNNLFLKKAT